MTQTMNSYSEISPWPSEKPKNSRGRAKFMVLLVISASGETDLICQEPTETHRDHLPAVRSTLESPVCIQPLPVFYPEKNTQTYSRWTYSSQPQPFSDCQWLTALQGRCLWSCSMAGAKAQLHANILWFPIAFKMRRETWYWFTQ